MLSKLAILSGIILGSIGSICLLTPLVGEYTLQIPTRNRFYNPHSDYICDRWKYLSTRINLGFIFVPSVILAAIGCSIYVIMLI